MADAELDKRSKELEIEKKKKFTEATIKLGHDRSELEVRKIVYTVSSHVLVWYLI